MKGTPVTHTTTTNAAPSGAGAVLFAWLLVGIPLAWGVLETLKKSLALFH
jgi:hypothetical protein